MTTTRTIAETLLFQLHFYSPIASEPTKVWNDLNMLEKALFEAEKRGEAKAKKRMQYNKAKEKADA